MSKVSYTAKAILISLLTTSPSDTQRKRTIPDIKRTIFLMDTGHVCQNIYLMAANLGLGTILAIPDSYKFIMHLSDTG